MKRALASVGLWLMFGAGACADPGQGEPLPAGEGEGEGEGEGSPPGPACRQGACPGRQLCHPQRGVCVECVSTADCGGDRPSCMLLTARCGCVSTAECGSSHRCDPAERRCIRDRPEGCLRDVDCPTGHCGPDGVCAFCLHDLHCPLGQVCDERRECADPVACADGGDHCPGGGVCDAAEGRCVPEDCGEGEGEGDECGACASDAECADGAFCDWASGACVESRRAGLCEPCGSDGQCLQPDGPGGECVERYVEGRPLERFCGRHCGTDRDCPTGYDCGEVGLGVFSCLPAALDASEGDEGMTCAALLAAGARCAGHQDCGLGGEGLCWQGACAYGCEDAGARRRPCVEGFVCVAVAEEVHPWGGLCLRSPE